MSAKAPDLTDQRQHAEAVAYGKLLAVREILDALEADRPKVGHNHGRVSVYYGDWRPECLWRTDYLRGYDRALSIVKGMRLGVEP